MEYKNKYDFMNVIYNNDNLDSKKRIKTFNDYLLKLEKVEDIVKYDEHKTNMLKQIYYEKYKNITKKEIIDNWFEYFIENDYYPMWFKNYAFMGAIESSSDNEKKYIIPDKNALFNVYKLIIKSLNNKNITKKELIIINQGMDFNNLYTYCIKEKQVNKNKIINDGQWKYCQIDNNDFYIYYTKDNDNKYTVPRVIIRINNNLISEVKGFGKYKNLEKELVDITDKKLKEFENYDDYKKKISDIKLLNIIEEKRNNNIELTKEEIAFLYELGYKIEGFGYKKDPRIKQIIAIENNIKNLAKYYDCDERKIILKQKEYNKIVDAEKDMVYYDRSLTVYDDIVNNKLLPKFINGNLSIINAKELKDIVLPVCYNGTIELKKVESMDNVKFPKKLKSLYLNNLNSYRKVELPEEVTDYLVLSNITKLKGFKFNSNKIKCIRLDNLRKITGDQKLIFPEEVEYLQLDNIEDIEKVVLPKKVDTISMNNIRYIGNLVLPEEINDAVYLQKLRYTNNLEFSEKVNGSVLLNSLFIANNVKFPKIVEGDLDLSGLVSDEDLILPEKVGRWLFLNNLKSINNVILPKEVGKYINLSGLEKDSVVILPERYKKIEIDTDAKIKYIKDDLYYKKDKKASNKLLALSLDKC